MGGTEGIFSLVNYGRGVRTQYIKHHRQGSDTKGKGGIIPESKSLWSGTSRWEREGGDWIRLVLMNSNPSFSE